MGRLPRILLLLIIQHHSFGADARCDSGGIDLEVTVHNAHVKTSDYLSKSDPFARLTVNKATKRTSSKSDTNNPRWEETLNFDCVFNVNDQSVSSTDKNIEITVYDYDPIGKDDKLMSTIWNYDEWLSNIGIPVKLYNNNKESAEYWVIVSATHTIVDNTPSLDDLNSNDEHDDIFVDVDDDNEEKECLHFMQLNLFSETGQGWQGVYYTFKTSSDVFLSSGTLMPGLYNDTVNVCILNRFDCYLLEISSTVNNYLLDHIHWAMIQPGTAKVLSQGSGHDNYNLVCADWLCEEDDQGDDMLLNVAMFSDTHDLIANLYGWNGNELEIYSCQEEYTLLFTSENNMNLNRFSDFLNFSVCIPRVFNGKGFFIRAIGGPPQSSLWEVSEVKKGARGSMIASGPVPGKGGDCDVVIESIGDKDTDSTCTGPCMGSTCDALTFDFGFLSNTCDYFQSSLNAYCDCSNCVCASSLTSHFEKGGFTDRSPRLLPEGTKCRFPYLLSLKMDPFTASATESWKQAMSEEWSGAYYEWSSLTDNVVVDRDYFVNNYTNIALCLYSERFSCFELFVDDKQSWSEGLSWELEDKEGNVISGQVPSNVVLCSDEVCLEQQGELIDIELMDSFGDGWNGNVLTLETCEGLEIAQYSLTRGSFTHLKECMSSMNFTLRVNGGTDQSEVSWSIKDGNGVELVAGGAPFKASNCHNKDFVEEISSDDRVVDCSEACFDGKTCAEIDLDNGMVDGFCDYYGVSLSSDWSCNCAGCKCESERSVKCESYWSLHLEGMGFQEDAEVMFSWKDNIQDHPIISSGSVSASYPAILCKHKSAFMCYLLNLSASQSRDWSGEWQVEESVGAVVAQGGTLGSFYMCDNCDEGKVLKLNVQIYSIEVNQNISLTISTCEGEHLHAVLLTNETTDKSLTSFLCVDGGVLIKVTDSMQGRDTSRLHSSDDGISWEVSNFNSGEILAAGNGENTMVDTCQVFPFPSLQPTFTSTGGVDSKDIDRSGSIQNGMIAIAVVATIVCFVLLWISWWQSGSPIRLNMSKAERNHRIRLARLKEQARLDEKLNTSKYRNIHTHWNSTCSENDFEDCDYHLHEGEDCGFELCKFNDMSLHKQTIEHCSVEEGSNGFRNCMDEHACINNPLLLNAVPSEEHINDDDEERT